MYISTFLNKTFFLIANVYKNVCAYIICDCSNEDLQRINGFFLEMNSISLDLVCVCVLVVLRIL